MSKLESGSSKYMVGIIRAKIAKQVLRPINLGDFLSPLTRRCLSQRPKTVRSGTTSILGQTQSKRTSTRDSHSHTPPLGSRPTKLRKIGQRRAKKKSWAKFIVRRPVSPSSVLCITKFRAVRRSRYAAPQHTIPQLQHIGY